MKNSGIRTTELASLELIEHVRQKGRVITIAKKDSEELRYLDRMGANANVGGPKMIHILLREDVTKVEVLEEFLHGTQCRFKHIEKYDVFQCEINVKKFLINHATFFGLSPKDVGILKNMLGETK